MWPRNRTPSFNNTPFKHAHKTEKLDQEGAAGAEGMNREEAPGKSPEDMYIQQKVRVLLMLKKMGSNLTPNEEAFLRNYAGVVHSQMSQLPQHNIDQGAEDVVMAFSRSETEDRRQWPRPSSMYCSAPHPPPPLAPLPQSDPLQSKLHQHHAMSSGENQECPAESRRGGEETLSHALPPSQASSNGAHQQRTCTDSRGTLWGEVLATGRLLETLTWSVVDRSC